MRRNLWPKAPAEEGAFPYEKKVLVSIGFNTYQYFFHTGLGQMSKKFQVYFIHINFFKKPKKKLKIEPKSYTAMLLYLFFDSLLSTCPKKMETEKWPKAAHSSL